MTAYTNTAAVTTTTTITMTKGMALSRTIAASSPGVVVLSSLKTLFRTLVGVGVSVVTMSKLSSFFRTLGVSAISHAYVVVQGIAGFLQKLIGFKFKTREAQQQKVIQISTSDKRKIGS